MSQLIGSNPTVDVLCTAKFKEGKKKINVTFNVIYERLTRKANKELKLLIQNTMTEFRSCARELAILEQDKACLSASGKVVFADERYLKELAEGQEASYLTDAQKMQERTRIEEKLEQLDKQISDKICNSVKDIKNLKGVGGHDFTFSEELLKDMLANEGYFAALRDGLTASTGAFEEERTKN